MSLDVLSRDASLGDARASDGGLLGAPRPSAGAGEPVGHGACVRSGLRLPGGPRGPGAALASRARGRGGREEGVQLVWRRRSIFGASRGFVPRRWAGRRWRWARTGRYARRAGAAPPLLSRGYLPASARPSGRDGLPGGEEERGRRDHTGSLRRSASGAGSGGSCAGEARLHGSRGRGDRDGEPGPGAAAPRGLSSARFWRSCTRRGGGSTGCLTSRSSRRARGVSRRRSCGCSGRARWCRSTWSRRARCSARGAFSTSSRTGRRRRRTTRARWRTSWCARPGGGWGWCWRTRWGAPVVSSSTGFASFETNRIYQAGLLEAPDIWLWEAMASGVSETKGFTLCGGGRVVSEAGRLVFSCRGDRSRGDGGPPRAGLGERGGRGGGDVCREAAVSAEPAFRLRCCGRERTSWRSRTWGTRGCTRSCSWTASR